MENQHLSEELSDWQQIQASENETEVSVFPPRNHENLPTTNPRDIDQPLQEQEPINSTDNNDGVGRWKRLRLEMRNAIFWISGKLGKYFSSKKVGLQSIFAWTASGIACLLMVYLLHRRVLVWWQRRMPLSSRKERMMEFVRQKDECTYCLFSTENQPAFTPNCPNERIFTCSPEGQSHLGEMSSGQAKMKKLQQHIKST
ncbi:DDB1- and CUL4-associated factor 8 [Striga asiatica]|uniref:DDB1-and CUL4-associated factor 8 n=1 Tax=Striga asiatica TaxID=4170 RepID=A0A5A7PGH3_STRAF|nr:DDB1- and CUL4-associated factor 8 [Striga asiatica]